MKTLKELQEALEKETDATKKAEIQKQIDELLAQQKGEESDKTQDSSDFQQPSVKGTETNTEKSTQDKLNEKAKELAEDYKKGEITKQQFAEKANDLLLSQFAISELSDGENPSAKYLFQEITGDDLPDTVKDFLTKAKPTLEFIPNGKGGEYIMTQFAVVCKADINAIIPAALRNTKNSTYVDTIDLPDPTEDMKSAQESIQLIKYLPYYLSGKLPELASLLLTAFNKVIDYSIFVDLLHIYERMYAVISAKTSSTEEAPTNYMLGTKDYMLDALKEMKDFVDQFKSHNNIANWGIDDGTNHTDFTARAGFMNNKTVKFITDKRTYNSIKEWLPTVIHSKDFEGSIIGDADNWITVPRSYLDVNINKKDTDIDENTGKAAIDEKPTEINNYSMFTKTVEGVKQRQKGVVLIVDMSGIKGAYNFSDISSDYYPQAIATQYWNRKNIVYKALKFCQVAVYENPVLESDFSIRTESASNRVLTKASTKSK